MTALHLLRHAHAGDPQRWAGDDDARPLSDKGRRQAERLARLLATLGDAPDLFITSPRVRARETAEIVARALGARVVEDPRLASGELSPATVEAIVDDAGDPERPCLVGHDPEFSELLAELLGAAELPMRKGAIARVDVGRPVVAGCGTLRWLVPPELLPG